MTEPHVEIAPEPIRSLPRMGGGVCWSLLVAEMAAERTVPAPNPLDPDRPEGGSVSDTITRVVRRVGSDVIHVADISPGQLTQATLIGADYLGVVTPVATRCGSVLRGANPAVCMRPGSKVSCSRCARMTGIGEAPKGNTAGGQS